MISYKKETLKPQMETYIDKKGKLVEIFNEKLEVEVNNHTLSMIETFENIW